MLTRLIIRNFKQFEVVDVELGKSVVFIGPNNSGKTTALQALALWNAGLRQWNSKRGGQSSPEKRPGVTINRRDLISIPVPAANLLWRDLHVRTGQELEGKRRTANIRIDVTAEGVSGDSTWSCGLEFDYSNEESIVCRPLRKSGYDEASVKDAKFSEIPAAANNVRVAFLPPMSGLADREYLKQPGEIDFLLGQGQTAQVLRNLCYRISTQENQEAWEEIVRRISDLFGVTLLPPVYIPDRGEITMEYRQGKTRLDLASSGRGLQQTLLLLAHLYANPGTILLLDEPDAHLEIIRQRQTYALLTEVAGLQKSQIVAASHSEVVLQEAVQRDVVIAFLGTPHRLGDRGSQIAKALKEIAFDEYYQAEQTGWVLYLEGATDFNILRAFAEKLGHPAASTLDRAFYRTVGNHVSAVRSHFFGLREAKPDLVAIAIFDRLERPLPSDLGARGLTWQRREIENYLCTPRVLEEYARDIAGGDLFATSCQAKMREIIQDMAPPMALRDATHTWWRNTKITDDFLDPLFERFFREINLPNLMRKSNYHELAKFVTPTEIDPEVREKLDAITEVAALASSRERG